MQRTFYEIPVYIFVTLYFLSFLLGTKTLTLKFISFSNRVFDKLNQQTREHQIKLESSKCNCYLPLINERLKKCQLMIMYVNAETVFSGEIY